MEPTKSEALYPYDSPISSKMMPINTSTWVSNTKRIQKKLAITKKGSNSEEVARQKGHYVEEANEEYASDLKDYIHSVKTYFVPQAQYRFSTRRRLKRIERIRWE